MQDAGSAEPALALDPAVGLCGACDHGHCQVSASGSRFWRCLRAGRDPGYRRYPPLPVERCPGFEAARGNPGPGPDS